MENADAIAAVQGLDLLHVGSFDLADALGYPAHFDHPGMLRCFERVIAACKKHGKVAGIGGVGGATESGRSCLAPGCTIHHRRD